MCVSEAKAIHLPPFNVGEGGRRSRAVRSDAGVGPPGLTARSDVRGRSEGNPPPTTILQSDVGIHFSANKKTLSQNSVLTAFFIYRGALRLSFYNGRGFLVGGCPALLDLRSAMLAHTRCARVESTPTF